ncbi:hypothetical protein IE53DRAFT_127567 [Violaceomyces palustris]|uniref:Uncharacterized protein n=1 Tax=Violaceomyces palustris TaxID=1673888 RepID=A0ACD0NVA8_9BASI|nr:hypothetical protein IE53DRAFT_127567 [Violaceomyces palustris]
MDGWIGWMDSVCQETWRERERWKPEKKEERSSILPRENVARGSRDEKSGRSVRVTLCAVLAYDSRHAEHANTHTLQGPSDFPCLKRVTDTLPFSSSSLLAHRRARFSSHRHPPPLSLRRLKEKVKVEPLGGMIENTFLAQAFNDPNLLSLPFPVSVPPSISFSTLTRDIHLGIHT